MEPTRLPARNDAPGARNAGRCEARRDIGLFRAPLLGLMLLLGGCQAMSAPEPEEAPAGGVPPHLSVGGSFSSMIGVSR